MIQRQIVRRPVQVRPRGIHTGRLLRAAGGRGAGEAAGVREEVEEDCAPGLRLDPRARLAVIGEQPGIDVVVEVDEEPEIALAHLDPFADAGEARILLAAVARLQMDAVRRHRERFGGRPRHRLQPGQTAGLLPRIFRKDDMSLVPVHRRADLRDVAVVEPESADALPLETRVQPAEVLPQPVGQHRRLLVQLHRPAAHRSI